VKKKEEYFFVCLNRQYMKTLYLLEEVGDLEGNNVKNMSIAVNKNSIKIYKMRRTQASKQ
jgi:hypothetical protein